MSTVRRFNDAGEEFEVVRFCQCGLEDFSHIAVVAHVHKHPKTGKVVSNAWIVIVPNGRCNGFRERFRWRKVTQLTRKTLTYANSEVTEVFVPVQSGS